jgi:hypothetical protein
MAYYANERSLLIGGLRALARYLEDNPDVSAPRWTDMIVFPPDGTDDEMRAEIDRIAARIGTQPEDRTAERGHYMASRGFGPAGLRRVPVLPALSCQRRPKIGSGANNVKVTFRS